MLSVDGKIVSKASYVSIKSWADYVFDKDYALPNLYDVETYYTTHKHLPNIPSAKEVADHGIELGAMNAKLLEKIEELTLYILQQHKDFNALKKEMAEIKSMVK